MNTLHKKLCEILGGRIDFEIYEIDPESLLDVSHKDISNNNVVSGQCMTADDIRKWLRTLPEPTFEELQDRLWHDHK